MCLPYSHPNHILLELEHNNTHITPYKNTPHILYEEISQKISRIAQIITIPQTDIFHLLSSVYGNKSIE